MRTDQAPRRRGFLLPCDNRRPIAAPRLHASFRARHQRPALRQRPAPPRPPGRLHPGRYLGAGAAHARRHGALTSAPTTPTARRSCWPRKRPGTRRKTSSPTSRPATSATSPRSAWTSTTTIRPTRAANRELTEAVLRAPRSRRPHRPAQRCPVLRSGQGHVPARPLHQGHLPELRHRRPVRRQLRGTAAPPTRRPTSRNRSRCCPAPPRKCATRSISSSRSVASSRFLREWLAGDVALAGVKAKLMEWLDAEGGLRAWDISRDAPYFGFEIPGQPGKYFYVWLDAPIGYLSSFKTLCANERRRLRRVPAERQRRRTAPFHRQGHRQLPRPVLASGAGRRRLSARRRACTSTAT